MAPEAVGAGRAALFADANRGKRVFRVPEYRFFSHSACIAPFGGLSAIFFASGGLLFEESRKITKTPN